MRTFSLSDGAASELWTALNNSTGGPPVTTQPVPPATPPAPPAIQPAPPAPVSEQDQIIAGILYTPPQGGWPKPSADQSKPADSDHSRVWLAVGSKGQGWYVDSKDVPGVPGTAGAPSWPYTGAGLLCVITEVGNNQTLRTNAERALEQLVGGQTEAARYHQANDNGDPVWTAAVGFVLNGGSAEQVIANLQSQGNQVKFNAGQLDAAKGVADSLR